MVQYLFLPDLILVVSLYSRARNRLLNAEKVLPNSTFHSMPSNLLLGNKLIFYESEENQREFQEWKAQRAAEQTEGKEGEVA